MVLLMKTSVGKEKFLEGLYLADTPCLVTEWEGRKLRVPLVTYPHGKLVRIGFFPVGNDNKEEMFCVEIVSEKDRETVFRFYMDCYKKLAASGKLFYRVYQGEFVYGITLRRSREELVAPGSVVIKLLPASAGCLISMGSLLEQGKK